MVFCPDGITLKSGLIGPNNTIYIYIYIYSTLRYEQDAIQGKRALNLKFSFS